MAVSLATILALIVTIIFYNFTYLPPGYNMLLNGGISFFWVMGFVFLSWSVSTSHVLQKACTGTVWGGEAEAGVCRDYKALWAMTLVGLYVHSALPNSDSFIRKEEKQQKRLMLTNHPLQSLHNLSPMSRHIHKSQSHPPREIQSSGRRQRRAEDQ